MKKLLLSFAVLAVVTGCVAVRLKPGASVTVLTTNTPPVINNVVTNPTIIPNSFVASLDADSQKTLVDAIKAAADKQIGPAQILLTNVNPINVYPGVTNLVVVPNPMRVELGDETRSALKPPPNSKWYESVGFWGTLIGAIVGFLASLISGKIAHDRQVKHDSDEKVVADEAFKKSVFSAIKQEATAVRGIYDKGLGSEVIKLGPSQSVSSSKNIFSVHASLTVNWFSVFDGNTSNLGRLEEGQIKAILTTYSTMKSLMESFRLNNQLLEEWNSKYPTATTAQLLATAASILHGNLISRAADIAKTHEEYVEAYNALLALK